MAPLYPSHGLNAIRAAISVKNLYFLAGAVNPSFRHRGFWRHQAKLDGLRADGVSYQLFEMRRWRWVSEVGIVRGECCRRIEPQSTGRAAFRHLDSGMFSHMQKLAGVEGRVDSALTTRFSEQNTASSQGGIEASAAASP
jgi:hypothetical protein